MTILISVYSMFGNTKRLADAMADALRKNATVNVVPFEKMTAADFAQANLIIVGSATQAFGIPPQVQPILKKLPMGSINGTPCATYDTAIKMVPFRYLTAAKKLTKELQRLGGTTIDTPMSFFVKGKKGPLLDGEIERAQVWASTLLSFTR